MAISIPIFTSQLTKARRAINQANARAAYAAAAAAYLTDDSIKGGTYDVTTGRFTTAATAPEAKTAEDYGASGAIPSFNVTITEGSGTTDSTISVTLKDSGTGATYNKQTNSKLFISRDLLSNLEGFIIWKIPHHEDEGFSHLDFRIDRD